MAKIFISYSRVDSELVKQYTNELIRYGHQILMDSTVLKPGADFQKVLMEAMRDADGTIAFLTENGSTSSNVISEVGVARTYFDTIDNKKFLIPLVNGATKVPFVIQDITLLDITRRSVSDNVAQIDKAIKDFNNQNISSKKSPEVNPTKRRKKSTDESPKSSAFKNLTIGSRGETVKQIQTALTTIGLYKSPIDGTYGPANQAAVREFQVDNKLPVTGEVDEETYTTILRIESNKKETTRTASSSPSQSYSIEPDKMEALQVVAERFTQDFNSLISENASWYSEVISEEDANLGTAISAALHKAASLTKDSPSWLAQPFSKDGKLIAELECKNFIDSIRKIISVSDTLFTYYQLNRTPKDDESDNAILNRFYQKAIQYHQALTQLEVLLTSKEPLPETVTVLIAPIDHSTPASNIDLSLIDSPFTLNDETLTKIASDVPNPDAVDSLDITPDVTALASVVSYKGLTPPLAIGLFGNWGSGKSFFMKKLRKQIDVFAADQGPDYVERVVHIEFNSWHYSDSNLWASFVTKIFEDLDSYGKNHPEAVKDLFKKLNSSSEFLTEANTKLESIKSTISTLEKELNKKKTEVSEKAGELSGIKLTDIAATVLKNEKVQKKLKEVKEQLPQKEIDNLSDIYRSVKELDGFVNKFIETIKIIISFKSWKSWVALVLFTLICTSPFWLFTFFNVEITDFFNWFGDYSAPVAIIFTNLAGIASYATIGLTHVQEKLKSLAGDCTELEKKSLALYQSDIDKIQAELDVQIQAQLQKEGEITKLKKEQAEIQATIEDVQSGKKLASFIAGRVTDQRYSTNLGLISWIRKDFQQLDKLLKEQRDVNKLSEKTSEEKEKIFQVDRIILYIDDLDRCNEDVVVKVLEAIHLLLAFELFVVIVGVDPRWMCNAIENRYNKQLKKVGNKNQAEDNSGIHAAATSYDYLEKIFQVPFCLKEMNPAGRFKLIDEQMKMDERLNPQPVHKTVPPIITSPESPEQKSQPTITPIEQSLPQPEAEKASEIKKSEAEVKRAKDQLIISPDEIKFMKDISELIGNTPRTVNRFINIYRIIRSHRNLKKSSTPMQDYCATMVLLGIITGLPNESDSFFELLLQKESGTFGSLLDETGDEFQLLHNACRIKFKISDHLEKTVWDLPAEFMQQKLELVQRFSFRGYSEKETPATTR